MTDEEKTLMKMLLDGWLGALHNVDTYSQILQDQVPDYRQRVDAMLSDPFRREMTEQRFATVRLVVEGVLAGESVDSLIPVSNAMLAQGRPN